MKNLLVQDAAGNYVSCADEIQAAQIILARYAAVLRLLSTVTGN